MPLRKEILEKLRATVDPERYNHSLRAEKIALALAKKHGVAKNAASLAALLHDCARRYDRPKLLKLAKKLGLVIDPVRKFEPKLFHAEIGAYLAKKEFGIRAKAILSAIRQHTTGKPRMTGLEKVIYLSDHLEEGRAFPAAARIRKLAFVNLDRAIVASAGAKLKFLLKHGLPIYPETIETRNYYLARI